MRKAPRLYVDVPLAQGQQVTLPREQSHYLVNVLRLKQGAQVLLFNGRDGEWRAEIVNAHKQAAQLHLQGQSRGQDHLPDITYGFAPLKSARLDYMAQKACEMGVKRIVPVMSQHVVAGRVNLERLKANVIEAAEQCELTALPEVLEPVDLAGLLAGREPDRQLIFCDETAAGSPSLEGLKGLEGRPLLLLIGPEGGFSDAERAILSRAENVTRLSLGPRILRADTAAVAALALLQAALGDWR